MQAFIINPFMSFPTVLNPPSFPNLQGWWKADSLSLNDGDPVTTWADSSGNGQTLTARATSTYHTNIAGSMPAVTVGGGFTFPGITLSSDFSIVSVLKIASDSMLLGNQTVNRQVRVDRSNGNTLSFYAGGSEIISSSFTMANVLLALAWRRASSTLSFRQNKTAEGTGSDGNSLTLNLVGDTSFGLGYNGYLMELFIYSSALSDSDVDLLYDSYLQIKWGLP
jgi:hypothetical protein